MLTIYRDFSCNKFKETQKQGTYYYEGGTRIYDVNKIHNFILIANNTDLLVIFDIYELWIDVKNWFSQNENRKKISNICIIIDGVLSIFGLVLKPTDKGGSIAVTLIGGILVISGSGLDMIADNIHNRNIKIIRNFNETMVGYVQIYPGIVTELEQLKDLYIPGIHTDYIIATQLRYQSNNTINMSILDQGPDPEFEDRFNQLIQKEKKDK